MDSVSISLKNTRGYILLFLGCLIPLATTFFLTQAAASAVPFSNEIEEVANDTDPLESDTSQTITDETFIRIHTAAPTAIKNDIVSVEKRNSVYILSLSDGKKSIVDADDSIETLQLQLTRLELILTSFDFESIESQIVEIDVRYKLPVLRTTHSY